ncbi:hypothetical protein L4D09_28375, partial [Photobacterium makurazakiensis]
DLFSAGPCISTEHVSVKISITKDTFMFVPPAIIEKYDTGLEQVLHDSNLKSYINDLEKSITVTK